MRHYSRRRIATTLGMLAAGLMCLPEAAFAQTAPPMGMLVQQTPHYALNLVIGPVESMVAPMDAMHGQTGEVAVSSNPMGNAMGMASSDMDQGMADNHHLEVHISLADSGSVVMDVTPTIRITDKSTGASRDLPQVMGMYGSSMGMSDFHYGQNVFLPDGTYQVTVQVGPSDTAEFRDVVVAASPMNPMMADQSAGHDMSMGHDTSMTSPMSMPAGTARDGRMFTQESSLTQVLFNAVWGNQAAAEWVKQHNASLPG